MEDPHRRRRRRRSIPPSRTRPGCTTTTWAARTTSPPTGRPRKRAWPPGSRAASRPGRTGRSSAGRCDSWSRRRASRSSLTSAPGCPPLTTCTRWRRPSSRRPVVYADNDPLVLAHARALLTSSPAGRTAYIHADLRDPQAILSDPAVTQVLDLGRPVALMLVAVLHFVPDEFGPAQVLRTLTDALPSGSYVVASHITGEHDPVGPATGRPLTGRPACPRSCATVTSSPGSPSRALSSCRRGSCSCRSGGRATAGRGRRRPRSAGTAASPGSRSGRVTGKQR